MVVPTSPYAAMRKIVDLVEAAFAMPTGFYDLFRDFAFEQEAACCGLDAFMSNRKLVMQVQEFSASGGQETARARSLEAYAAAEPFWINFNLDSKRRCGGSSSGDGTPAFRPNWGAYAVDFAGACASANPFFGGGCSLLYEAIEYAWENR